MQLLQISNTLCDISRLIRLAAAALLAVCPVVANAQQLAAPFAVAPQPDAVIGTPIPAGDCCGYWIVSTHSSPQSFDASCPPFCPRIMRYDECGGHRNADYSEMMQSIQPGIPICIVVHGSFVGWEGACIESRYTWKWLGSACPGRPFQMIYFTWPSDREITPLVQLDVAVLGRRASRNGYYLATLIQQLPPESPVCLVGHSHGTRVISSALHMMAGGEIDDVCHPCVRTTGRKIRAVYAAAAIDHDWLNPEERFGRALCTAECILNLKNSHDPALKIYPLRRPFSSRALGQAGFTSKDRREMGGWGRRAAELDVTNVIGHGHFWPEYFQRPGIARSIANYVFFPDYIVSYENHPATQSPQPAMTVPAVPGQLLIPQPSTAMSPISQVTR
ncbi:MAG: alpha/beta hydrolase [Planctomyces sp.]|nr:alpha/beta hydrolase [Planctomyces sp.]